MSDWPKEKRARFVFFLGIGFLTLLTVDPGEVFSRLDYQDAGWVYDDGWMHLFSCALTIIGSWKWIEARPSETQNDKK